jgi:hypothetical protein
MRASEFRGIKLLRIGGIWPVPSDLFQRSLIEG